MFLQVRITTVRRRQKRERKAINAPAIPGVYYEAEVPDTLDLAEWGRLGLNFFASQVEESLDWEMYFVSSFTGEEDPPACSITPMSRQQLLPTACC